MTGLSLCLSLFTAGLLQNTTLLALQRLLPDDGDGQSEEIRHERHRHQGVGHCREPDTKTLRKLTALKRETITRHTHTHLFAFIVLFLADYYSEESSSTRIDSLSNSLHGQITVIYKHTKCRGSDPC